jgi:hypothetical protein
MAAWGSAGGERPREERISVVIPSRMRVNNSWSDVCIRNISTRGLLVAVTDPPPPGSYVEIRRGTQIIVARTVWARGNYLGLRSQEKLPVQRIIAEPRLTKRPSVAVADGVVDRRADSRHAAPADIAARSRRFASMAQYVLFASLAIGVSGWAATSVYAMLGSPLGTIEQALAGE